MYTDGKVIIEKKRLNIEVVSEHTEIIYTLKNEEEAYNFFITLILRSEKKKLL